MPKSTTAFLASSSISAFSTSGITMENTVFENTCAPLTSISDTVWPRPTANNQNPLKGQSSSAPPCKNSVMTVHTFRVLLRCNDRDAQNIGSRYLQCRGKEARDNSSDGTPHTISPNHPLSDGDDLGIVADGGSEFLLHIANKEVAAVGRQSAQAPRSNCHLCFVEFTSSNESHSHSKLASDLGTRLERAQQPLPLFCVLKVGGPRPHLLSECLEKLEVRSHNVNWLCKCVSANTTRFQHVRASSITTLLYQCCTYVSCSSASLYR